MSAGGPVVKNKLFFFGTWAQSIQPVTNNATAVVLSAAAQQGNFTYRNTAGALQAVNVLQLAGNSGYRSTVLPEISGQLQKINSVLNQGSLTPNFPGGIDPTDYTSNSNNNRIAGVGNRLDRSPNADQSVSRRVHVSIQCVRYREQGNRSD